jgi:hypothetical protein
VLECTPPATNTIVDPGHGATLITRIHSHMVYDTPCGIDDAWGPQPRMAEGHEVEDGGRTCCFFPLGTPYASDAGMSALKHPPDLDAARRMLAASGYAAATPVAVETLPCIPTGMWLPPAAYRADLADVRRGFPQCYGVRRV